MNFCVYETTQHALLYSFATHPLIHTFIQCIYVQHFLYITQTLPAQPSGAIRGFSILPKETSAPGMWHPLVCGPPTLPPEPQPPRPLLLLLTTLHWCYSAGAVVSCYPIVSTGLRKALVSALCKSTWMYPSCPGCTVTSPWLGCRLTW